MRRVHTRQAMMVPAQSLRIPDFLDKELREQIPSGKKRAGMTPHRIAAKVISGLTA